MGSLFERTRLLQVLLLCLYAVCIAQVVYWILDQVAYTDASHERILVAYAADARAADAESIAGEPAEAIRARFPHLVGPMAAERGGWAVDPAAIEQLDEERHSRINRFGWEGAFFLVVLLAGMVILSGALRRDAELRRRQQNFLAAVTHEFKSPLASLRLSAETFDLRDPTPERRTELVGRMIGDVDRLEAMVFNILDTTRIEEGTADARAQRVDLAKILTEDEQRLRRMADEQEVVLHVDAAAGAEILAAPEALHTIVQNLVDNAIKATAAVQTSGAKRDAEVRVSCAVEGSSVVLRVADSGLGFPPEEARRIFEKFYRIGDELRRTNRGTGLGLYLVHLLVTESGGEVEAISEGFGRGATFTVSWPAAKAEAVA